MRALLGFLGALYLSFGIVSFLIALYSFVYGPPLFEGLSFYLVPVPALNAVASFAMAYAFFRRRRWGRYLAVSLTAIYLAVWLAAFAISVAVDWNYGEFGVPLPVLIVLVAVLIILIAVMVISLRRSVREAMDR